VPELRRTNEEIQATAHNWGQLGEHFDGFLQTNQDRLVQTVDNLNTTLTRVAGLFSDENQHNLTVMLSNVRTSTDTLQSLTRNTDDLVKESRQTVQKIGSSVARADDAMTNLQQATKPLAERSNSVMKNLDESTEKLNQTMTQVQELLRIVYQSDGTLKRVIVDPSLYNHLDETACMLQHILPRLDRVMQDIQVFADKIARHPESLGISGVVRPGSGIK
jgi:phospholipid/cholesterol/gamma-HCH transport system substrate-binding protein